METLGLPDVARNAVRPGDRLRAPLAGTSALSAAPGLASWVLKARDPELVAPLPPGEPGPQADVLAVADRHEAALTDAVYEMLGSWRKHWTLARLRQLLATAPGTAADALDPSRPKHGLLAELAKASNGQAVEDVLIQIIATTAESPYTVLDATLPQPVRVAIDEIVSGPGLGPSALARRLVELGASQRDTTVAMALYRYRIGATTQSELIAAVLRADPSLAAALGRSSQLTAGSFTMISPHAVAFAANQSAALVSQIDDATRAAIRAIITRGQTEGLTIDAMARLLRDTISLHPRQANAVANLRALLTQIAAGAVDPAAASSPLIAGSGPGRAALIARGMSEEAIEEVVGRYADRALRYRAQMIARTETVRAANAGLLAGWQDAIDSGYLSASESWVEWFVNPDDRLCDICRSMANSAAKDGSSGFLDPDFDNGSGARGVRYLGDQASRFRGPPRLPAVGLPSMGQTYDQPPAHPGCRCTMVLHVGLDETAAGPRTVRTDVSTPPPSGTLTSLDFPDPDHNIDLAVRMNAQRGSVLGRDPAAGMASDAERRLAKDHVATQLSEAIDRSDLTRADLDEFCAFLDEHSVMAYHSMPPGSSSYDIASAFVQEWASSSGDSRPISLAYQRLARRLFGAGVDPMDVYDAASGTRLIVDLALDSPGFVRTANVILQAQYDATQRYLRDRGITQLLLARGAGSRALPDVGRDVTFTLNPLSSFTTNRNTAVSWSDRTVYVNVPADRVFSTPLTGNGCLGNNEDEVVLLGPRPGHVDHGHVTDPFASIRTS